MIQSELIISVGVLFTVGLFADQIGRRSKVPRVTLLLACGMLASAFDLVPEQLADLSETATVIALSMVAFLLGGSFKADTLKAHGAAILCISLAIILTTLLLVTSGLFLLGADPALALVLASVATATAPATTLDVIRQSGVSNGFTQTIRGIVAVDDAWGLLAFSICLAVATQVAGSEAELRVSVVHEIGGALILGCLIGLPAVFLTGRIDAGEPLLVEALSVAFLTAGLAVWLGVSFLITGMTAGALVANFARHHRRAFHEIEHIQWPFMIVFFILAGAALDTSSISKLGVLGAVLVVLRIAARLLGGWLGAAVAKVPKPKRGLYGAALLPQAGVAIGMALLAGQALPQWKDQIMGLTIGATVVFEIIGPFATMWALKKSDQV
ncbi:cation:proton antiporter [Leisingera aquaemixtae]|uniref:cation:proton antiporter n=1 Tax=Leisingera aquaemixtae TaxID=1396826 RepID=UPI001C942373|nr:cation:proton antiporter [Leisingera aquaemixtae]MBY6069438.1 cation:proton antiporter [Leisingera aquaemixtae]